MTNKWISIPLISVLVLGLIASGYFLWQQTNALEIAHADITDLETNNATLEESVNTLENNIDTLEENVSTLETQVLESETIVSNLEEALVLANNETQKLQADVSTQRNINTSLTEELKTIKSPRNFESTQELADWLYEDDTDTLYADEDMEVVAYILMIRAMRDGYLLPAITWLDEYSYYTTNSTIIGDELYYIIAWEDEYYFITYVDPIPTAALSID